MPDIPRGWRLVAAVFAVCLLAGMIEPGTASAQELRPSLRVPTVIASVAAAADWASTYHAMTNYHVRETNVLLQGFQGSPVKPSPRARRSTWRRSPRGTRSSAPVIQRSRSPACGPWLAFGPSSSSTTSATNRRRSAALADIRCGPGSAARCDSSPRTWQTAIIYPPSE